MSNAADLGSRSGIGANRMSTDKLITADELSEGEVR
jgi:hypothetical protein